MFAFCNAIIWGGREGNRTRNVFLSIGIALALMYVLPAPHVPNSGSSFQLPPCNLDAFVLFIKIWEMSWCTIVTNLHVYANSLSRFHNSAFWTKKSELVDSSALTISAFQNLQHLQNRSNIIWLFDCRELFPFKNSSVKTKTLCLFFLFCMPYAC